MELLQLKYFQTVARFESMTRAAAHHGVPQPSMSQTISRLERELGGIRLFDRMNNKLYLNENGRIFLEYVDKALMTLDNGVKAISTASDEIAGHVSLVVMENRRFILTCVSRFAEQYPHVTFSIFHDFSSTEDDHYDLCISSIRASHHMRTYKPFIQERIVLNVHEDHPLAHRDRISLRELSDEKFITMSSRSSLYAITFEQCRSNGFDPHVPFICDDPYFVRKYVAENMGIALAPSLSWAGRFRENTRLIPVDDPPILSTSYLMWNDQRYMSPAAHAFSKFLMQQAAALEGNLLAGDAQP
ncbi:MAG: LysR family transcriptional regulator [Clostridia bacterium]|nr:LysR family transcriptional regulator [Clostridia bacterium]